MCENIDWNVGRLLKKLNELEIADNTIVIYFSDNGPNGYRWNADMKGRKGSVDEGGVRSPFFIRWPGKSSLAARWRRLQEALICGRLSSILLESPKRASCPWTALV